MPDSSFDALCAGYEAHHWHSTSNCLHACGMLLSFGLVATLMAALASSSKARWVGALTVASVIPPTWYLYAWAGHYLFQADIPAVFTYGMTLRGWAAGELCSTLALLGGRTVGPKGPNAAVGREEHLLTAVLLAVYLIAARPAWMAMWRVSSGSKPKAT